MARLIHPSALAAALGLLGCPAPTYSEFTDTSPPPAPGATTSGGEQAVPTGGWTSGVQTVTGDGETTQAVSGDSSSGGSTTADTKKPGGPLILDFYFTPKHLGEAGQAIATLVTTPAAATYSLKCDGAPCKGEPPDDAAIGAFDMTIIAATAEDNGHYDFEVTVHDGEGGSDFAMTSLDVKLPQPGTVRCAFTDAALGASTFTGMTRAGDTLILVGTYGDEVLTRLALWKLDARTCQKLPGWPRLLTAWTADKDLGLVTSEGTGVATDALGRIAVVGHVGPGLTRRPYVALLAGDGALAWEKLGALGEEVRGVAISPQPYGAVVAVGARWLVDPKRRDAVVWHHISKDTVVVEHVMSPFVDGEADDPDGSLDEIAYAVLADPATAEIVVAGERDLETAPDLIFRRGFVLRFGPLGGRLGAWTSSGDYTDHDGARAIARCEGGMRLGGWASADLDDAPQPLTRWLDPLGVSQQRRAEGYANTRTFGVACDRLQRTVCAATTDELGKAPRAALFAFVDDGSPPSWKADGGVGTVDAAYAVDCDAWGLCAWAGFQRVKADNDRPHAHLRILHP